MLTPTDSPFGKAGILADHWLKRFYTVAFLKACEGGTFVFPNMDGFTAVISGSIDVACLV